MQDQCPNPSGGVLQDLHRDGCTVVVGVEREPADADAVGKMQHVASAGFRRRVRTDQTIRQTEARDIRRDDGVMTRQWGSELAQGDAPGRQSMQQDEYRPVAGAKIVNLPL